MEGSLRAALRHRPFTVFNFVTTFELVAPFEIEIGDAPWEVLDVS